MKSILRIAAAAALFAACATGMATAHEIKAGDLVIDHPWIKATPPGAKVAGGYVKITNTGSTPDRLIGGSMERAARMEIHQMSMDGDVMKMRPVSGGLVIAPGATLELKPGSFHAMFMGLQGSMNEDEVVKGTLIFEKAGEIAVDFMVDGMGVAAGDAGHGHNGAMKHD